MLTIVIGKNKTSFLREKINAGAVVFDNFGGDLHPTEIQKLVDNLLSLPPCDIYLGTNSYTVIKIFGLLVAKNDLVEVGLYDADSIYPTSFDFSCNSLIDFSVNLYKQEIDLHD